VTSRQVWRHHNVDCQLPACDLLGTAHLGDWVDIEVVPTRVGRRLAAGRATFRAGDRAIATASALFVPQ